MKKARRTKAVAPAPPPRSVVIDDLIAFGAHPNPNPARLHPMAQAPMATMAIPGDIHVPKHWHDNGQMDVGVLGAPVTHTEITDHAKHWRGHYHPGDTRGFVMLYERRCLAYNCWMTREADGTPRLISEPLKTKAVKRARRRKV